jgi:hypothetical protein
MHLTRRSAILAGLALAACGAREDLTQPPEEPIGDFALGLNVVVGSTARPIPPSRTATAEEWEAALTKAIDERFRRYQGTRLYNLGVSVDAYSLAIPGVPVVLKPRSVVVISATLWDDAMGVKVNATPAQLTVLEPGSGKTFIGSGLTQTKDEQMANLSFAAARAIERWMRANLDWFAPDGPRGVVLPPPGAARPD